MDKDTIICRCNDITLGEIEKAIEEGARTLDGVKKRTRSGMGLCQGRTCNRLIVQIMSEKGFPREKLLPFNSRPPVRAILIEALSKEGGLDE
jgi:NAD(P)H-nitrite reductase large subunit